MQTQTDVQIQVLKHDIPVDRNHVEVLKASIKERGQLAPILVRPHNWGIIDGFHRVTALHELGAARAEVRFIDCTDEEFANTRIISAAMHKGVSFARVTLWVNEMFVATPWSAKLTASEAFKIAGKQPNRISSKAFKDAITRGLSRDAIYEVVAWIKAKSAIWGLTPEQVANMLSLADAASPALWSLVRNRKHNREDILTRPALTAIVRSIPDHTLQEAVASKVMAEKLTEKETVQLVHKIAEQPEQEELESILTTSWLDANRKPAQPVLPIVIDEAEREHRTRIFQLTMAAALTTTLAEHFQVIPHPEMLVGMEITECNKLDSAINNLYGAIAAWQRENRDAVDRLRTENFSLKGELENAYKYNKSLETQLHNCQKQIGLGQKIYMEGVG